VLRGAQKYDGDMRLEQPLPTTADRWIVSRLNSTIIEVDRLMREFQFGEAQRYLHDFLWGELCDWYIEIAKIHLNDAAASPVPVLIHVLEKSLRLLHPFMPFITEELWQHLRPYLPQDKQPESIMIAPYPRADEAAIDATAERVMTAVTGIVHAIRNARAENNVPAGRCIEATVYSAELSADIAAHKPAINTLAGATSGQHGRHPGREAAAGQGDTAGPGRCQAPGGHAEQRRFPGQGTAGGGR
jgi:valyl-tRNA synthetase